MYDINQDAIVPVTVLGFHVIHYQVGVTGKCFSTDEEIEKSTVDLKLKLCPGHWIIVHPKIKQPDA